jgi:hypothetical protein
VPHLEENERNLPQLVLSLGELTLRYVFRIFTPFFQCSNRDDANDKRVKRVGPSGLLAGWKQSLAKEQARTINGDQIIVKSYSTTCSPSKLIARNVSNTSASNILVDDEDPDPLEYAGGEFDADEPAESIQAARVSKAKVSVHIGGMLSN